MVSGLTFGHDLNLTSQTPALAQHCPSLGTHPEIENKPQQHLFSSLAFVHSGALQPIQLHACTLISFGL